MKLSRRKLSEYVADRLAKGDSVKAVMKELAAHLVDTRRTREAELIIRDIEARLLKQGVALVTVTSARALTFEAKQLIETLVKTEQSSLTKVVLREQIDESVIGGVRIELPGRLADFTIKAKLDKLTT